MNFRSMYEWFVTVWQGPVRHAEFNSASGPTFFGTGFRVEPGMTQMLARLRRVILNLIQDLVPKEKPNRFVRVCGTITISMPDITQNIIPLLTKYRVKRAGLFGSYAKGTQNNASDVDIIIEPPKHMGLSFLSLKHELEEVLHKKIDLVSYRGVSPYLKDTILRTQIPLL